eukprot:scaffold75995_cov17-Tisochrysis_lutea.AAC.4
MHKRRACIIERHEGKSQALLLSPCWVPLQTALMNGVPQCHLQERTIGGEGMPISKTPGKRGDLVVRFEVSFPRSLTDDQKSKLRAALPSL